MTASAPRSPAGLVDRTTWDALRLGALAIHARLAEEVRMPIALGLVVVTLSTYLERRLVPGGALERALIRDTFGVVLPLVVYGVFERVTRSHRLDAVFRSLARHGASGRLAWLGGVCVLATLMAIVGMMFAAVTVLTGRGGSDPSLASDLAATVPVGALAGAAYACWLALGSDLGEHGSGRKWLLLVDFLFGAGSGSGAVLFPRPHVANLLGGEPLLGFSQRTASVLLLLSMVFALLVALGKAPD